MSSALCTLETVTMDKRFRLIALGHKRQNTRRKGYGCIRDYHAGEYECDFVSPYSMSASNVDASLMVLLQDWSSESKLAGPLDRKAVECGYTPALRTNVNLIDLLKRHFGFELNDIFATNVFPFVKKGPMNAQIGKRDLIWAAEEFAIPQIEIVMPSIAACLGCRTFNAVRQAAGMEAIANVEQGIESPFRIGSTEVWCQAHTGQLGKNNRNRGGIDRVNNDWARMATAHNKQLQGDRRGRA